MKIKKETRSYYYIPIKHWNKFIDLIKEANTNPASAIRILVNRFLKNPNKYNIVGIASNKYSKVIGLEFDNKDEILEKVPNFQKMPDIIRGIIWDFVSKNKELVIQENEKARKNTEVKKEIDPTPTNPIEILKSCKEIKKVIANMVHLQVKIPEEWLNIIKNKTDKAISPFIFNLIKEWTLKDKIVVFGIAPPKKDYKSIDIYVKKEVFTKLQLLSNGYDYSAIIRAIIFDELINN